MKLAEEIVANSTDLIMEATFDFEEDCILLKSWKEKYDLDLYCLICENEIEERRRRIKQRESDRHISHYYNDCIRFDSKNIQKVFNYDLMPDKKIRIKTDLPPDELVESIIKNNFCDNDACL